MQRAIRILCAVIVVGSMSVAALLADPRFLVPLKVSDGMDSLTVYFGIRTGGNFCIVAADSISGQQEFFLPPVPPGFDARLVWPRTGSSPTCFDLGSPVDIRPFTSGTQKDTLRVKSQMGDGQVLIISWPAGLSSFFTQLTIRFVGQTVGTVNTNMLTETSVDITDAGSPANATIYSGGLVVTSVEQTSPDVPAAFALSQNYPNPFNPSTTISFAVQQTAATDISVYSVLGQKVATLTSEVLTPGYYTTTWEGNSSAGVSVSSGVYFVRMTAQGDNGTTFSAARRLLLMK